MSAIERACRVVCNVAALASVFIVVGSARLARAADATMSECLAANESAINLRRDHKLRQARAQAIVCSASSCPGEVRDACQARVRDLSAAIPTIIFLAKDSAGRDLVDVRVAMDGEPIGDHLDGTAIPIDPGQHKFTFEIVGHPPVTQSLVISQSEKDRRETVTVPSSNVEARVNPNPAVAPKTVLMTAEVTPETAPAATSSGAGQRIAGLVIGAVGLVGLGVGAVTGVMAASDWSNAKSYCNGKPVSCSTDASSPGVQDENAATTMATISTISFIAGGVLAAGGTVFFLIAPKNSSAETSASARRVEVLPTGTPRGAGLLVRGWF